MLVFKLFSRFDLEMLSIAPELPTFDDDQHLLQHPLTSNVTILGEESEDGTKL